MSARLVVMARAPEAGKVKTRLIPALGPEGACALHRWMVQETLRRAAEAGAPILLSVAGPLDHPDVQRWSACVDAVEAQVEGDLGARLRHALRGPGRRVAIGTDCPFFPLDALRAALRSPSPLIFGPAMDGGYWLVALEAPLPALFTDIPWSSAETLAASVEAAGSAGLPPGYVAAAPDVDEPADLPALLADPRCPPSLRALPRLDKPHAPGL
jgi:rSAM/selenodomain-associated transferase 1